MIYCKNCGTKLPDGVNFCVKCGAKMKQDRPVTASVPTPPNNKVIKKKKKPIYKRWWFWVIIVIVAIGLIPNESDADSVENETQKDTATDAADVETTMEMPEESTIEIPVGSAKSNPFVLTATELADEINTDIAAAKEKYNGKWVKITGEISDTSDGGVVYGYYIYGKSITTGYRGLRIMCWCADGPYSGSVIGDTQTFIGQVLEITTVNATEIVDCDRVK